uniref:Uncharacterized protein n=1 Tax=Solanum lycopersicum TaxID=4081 RepID=A0A3Q7G2I3_SOLLC
GLDITIYELVILLRCTRNQLISFCFHPATRMGYIILKPLMVMDRQTLR